MTFDPLTLNFYSTSRVMCSNSVQKFERNRIIRGGVIDYLARCPILRGEALCSDGSQRCVDTTSLNS